MQHPEWLYEQGKAALFPEIEWSRPVTRQGSGKLLIIGGQAQDFASVASAYQAAESAGAGTIRVLMPDATQKYTKMLPNIEYAPTNPSGSFSKRALAEFLDASSWADHVLLAGDLGKNSETTTILDGYLLKCPRPVTITNNALSSIGLARTQLLSRPATLVVDTPTLQKIVIEHELTQALTSTSGRMQIATILHELTTSAEGNIVYRQNQSTVWVSHKGRVCVSKAQERETVQDASTSTVWLMQQPSKPFEVLVSSLALTNDSN